MQPLSYLSKKNPSHILRDNLPKKIKIFETTLREGDQTPTVAFTVEQKIDIAKRLDDFGVDIIEAGFVSVSPKEEEAIRRVCKLGLNAEIVAEGMCNNKEMDLLIDCGVDIAHTLLGFSDSQLKSLNLDMETAINKAVGVIEYCKSRGVHTDFSVLDSTRTEIGSLVRVAKEVNYQPLKGLASCS